MVKLTYANQKNSAKFDEVGHPIPERIEVVFSFDEPYIMFGEIRFVQIKDQAYVDTEYLSLDRVAKFLQSFIDSAITDTDQDPVRHKKYNKVMSRSCGSGCEVCYPRRKNGRL